MIKPKPHLLALEVDRTLILNLSNGQFEILVLIIDSYEDSRKFSNELMTKNPRYVLGLIDEFKSK